jgi:hypothetical protein
MTPRDVPICRLAAHLPASASRTVREEIWIHNNLPRVIVRYARIGKSRKLPANLASDDVLAEEADDIEVRNRLLAFQDEGIHPVIAVIARWKNLPAGNGRPDPFLVEQKVAFVLIVEQRGHLLDRCGKGSKKACVRVEPGDQV